MKRVVVAVAALTLALVTGCGTIGGMVDGAGDDLKYLGQMIRN